MQPKCCWVVTTHLGLMTGSVGEDSLYSMSLSTYLAGSFTEVQGKLLPVRVPHQVRLSGGLEHGHVKALLHGEGGGLHGEPCVGGFEGQRP